MTESPRPPSNNAPLDPEADALQSLGDAAMVHAPAWLALVSALGSVRPPSIGAAIDWLNAHREILAQTYEARAQGPLALAALTADLCYEPELSGHDRPRNDHLLRGRYLLRDLFGKRSFMQVAVFAITGIDLSPTDAEMVEQMGVANVAADRRAWPLTVTRRVAGHGGDFTSAVVAGTAVTASTLLGAGAGANAARILLRIDAEIEAGKTLEEAIDGFLARRETITGFGRPVVGPDERVPPVQAAIRKAGRDRGKHVSRLRAMEAILSAKKGLQTNVAAWVAAALLDLGCTADGVHAVCSIYLSPCIYGQATFSAERFAERGER